MTEPNNGRTLRLIEPSGAATDIEYCSRDFELPDGLYYLSYKVRLLR